MSSIELDDAGVIPAPNRGARPAPRVSRAQEARAATQRRGVGGEHRGRLHIDSNLLDPTLEYTWIREETLGERDKGNIQDALDNQGYDPVSSKDNPQLAGKQLAGWEDKDALVRRGGLVLMSRPKQIAREVRQDLAAQNEEAIRSVSRTLDESRANSNPDYIQKPKDERIAVEVDRTGSDGRRERFRDA